MIELMLKPGWPGTFRRSVKPEKGKLRLIVFEPNKPVEVTASELKALASEIGRVVFEIERDEKNRPRFIESEPVETEVPTKNVTEQELVGNVAHV